MIARPKRWLDEGGLVLKVGLALIGLQTALRAWMLLPTSYWQDDFAYLLDARQRGLTMDFLFQDYNGHIMPAGFFLNWVVAQFPGSFLPAALCILVLQLIASILWLALLRRLIGDSPGMLVGFAIYLFTPLSLAAALWWAASTQAIPLQISMALMAYCHVRYTEQLRIRWLIGASVGLVIGFLFWEKAGVAPIFTLMVAVFLLRGPARQVISGLLRQWRAWVAYFVISLAGTITYAILASPGNAHVQSFGGLVRLIRISVLDTFIIGLLGGPWTSKGLYGTAWPMPSQAEQLIGLQLFALLVVLAVLLRGRESLWAWAVLVVQLAADLTITAIGRGYWGDFLALDPRYIADSIPVAALAIGFSLTPPRQGLVSVRMRHFADRQWAVGAVAIFVVINSSLITNLALSDELKHSSVATYVDNVRKALHTDPDLDLYNGGIPGNLMVPAFGTDRARVRTVLEAYGLEPHYDLTSERLRVLDDVGVPRPIQLAFAGTANPDEVKDCGAALSTSESRVLPLSEHMHPGRWVLRLDYFTGGNGGTGVVTVRSTSVPLALQHGMHSVFMVVPGDVSQVTVKNEDASGVVCVARVVIGFPIPDVS